MAKPIRKTYTTTGAQAWIPVDHFKNPFEVSCFIEGGTASSIDFTVDDLQDESITPIVAGVFTTSLLNIPATGVRITITTAPLTFKVLQSGR